MSKPINDFHWDTSDEPHRSRRLKILEKYPEIKQLFGHDTTFKWKVSFVVILQIASLFLLQDKSLVVLLVAAYFFGGVISESLFLAIHEISHNLAFGHANPMANRLFGLFCNLPLGFPLSVTFKKYHMEHHRYLGDEILDTDLPTEFEAKLIRSTFGKFFWILFQPFFYFSRPFFVNPKQVEKMEVLNFIVQITFDVIVWKMFGVRMLVYLIGGTLWSMGLHPAAGHFFSGHYMFVEGYDTFSYYGPMNMFTWNVGYHTEHHDFPAVPGSRLPLLTKIAPEFYETMPHHYSWVKVLYDLITKPYMGPYSRIKRTTRLQEDHSRIIIDGTPVAVDAINYDKDE